MSADAPVEIPLEITVDPTAIGQSLSDVRSLLFAINSVKNLAADVTAMASEPTLQNAFWLGLQAKMTANRVKGIGEDIETGIAGIRGFGSSIMAFAATSPYAAIAVGTAIGVSVVAGIASYELGKENEFKKWEQRQRDFAKQQGLEP